MQSHIESHTQHLHTSMVPGTTGSLVTTTKLDTLVPCQVCNLLVL